MTSVSTMTTTIVESEAQGGKDNNASITFGGRDRPHGTAITRQRTHGQCRSTRLANPATKIPLERIEQYSRFKSTPVIHQVANRRESDLELRVLPTSILANPPTDSSSTVQFGRPKHPHATRSEPQITAERRMAGAITMDSLSTAAPSPSGQSGSNRRLSFTLTRTGTRHSDRTGRRLSTTSSHATTHSWYGASGMLTNLPTPGLLSSLAGAAHYTGNPKFSRQAALRASYGTRDVILEEKRQQTLDDVMELFCSHPSLEIFERSWHRDAVFEDPLTKCRGYREYAAQWYALPKIIPQSATLHHRVLSSTHYPHRIVFDQTQEYNLRFLKRKKIVQSLVTLELDEDGKIIRMEDRWNGEEMPRRWGALFLRRLNGKTMPLFVRVPRPAPDRTPTPV